VVWGLTEKKGENEFKVKKIKNGVFNLFYAYKVNKNYLGREPNKGEMREKRYRKSKREKELEKKKTKV
jgi:hypothetical protein